MSNRGWYRVLMALAWAGGLATGVALGLFSPWSFSSDTIPVRKVVSLDRSSHEPIILDEGWGKPEIWGTLMRRASASITLGFDGPAAGDVELLAEARLVEGTEDTLVAVRYNDAELGKWLMSPKLRIWRRRFVIPKAVFNRRTDGILSFQTQEGQYGRFGLEGITLRDASGLGVQKGFLDHCTSDRLTGWAVAQDTPVNVFVTVDGAAYPVAFANVYRPDLEAHGIPPDAGFELTTKKPIAPGSRVEVRFANGRPLNGSPCQL